MGVPQIVVLRSSSLSTRHARPKSPILSLPPVATLSSRAASEPGPPPAPPSTSLDAPPPPRAAAPAAESSPPPPPPVASSSPAGVRNRLPSLRSLCMTLCAWRCATAVTISRAYAAHSGSVSRPLAFTTSASVRLLQSSMRMYTFAASSKHRTNRTTCALSHPRWMRISVRIFALARSFSSVLFATTFAAKFSPVDGSCMPYTTANPPLPSGLPRTYVRVLVSPVRAHL